ncbi:hypothetical protein [Rickettsia endosymbiont of Gonocerus acuteangulatus]|uniref:hypothetical protein n=1 Tax=Rickettsia endosymbiont of Gonocerus acuteangulatus TaxID=3066266 RepID=UPI00313302CC
MERTLLKITDVEELLNKHNLRISPNTRIDICAHGRRLGEEHTLNLENKKIKTKDFLQQLQNLSPQNPLYIHIWACHGGTANKDVEILNPGSIA